MVTVKAFRRRRDIGDRARGDSAHRHAIVSSIRDTALVVMALLWQCGVRRLGGVVGHTPASLR